MIALSSRSTCKLAFIPAYLILLGGCGGAKKLEVSGTVTYQGQKLDSGSVVMMGDDGIPRTGAIAPDGSYTVKEVPPGDVRIGVVNLDTSPRAVKKLGEKLSSKEPGPTAPVGEPKTKIPDSYADLLTSGLKATIKSGNTFHNIEIP